MSAELFLPEDYCSDEYTEAGLIDLLRRRYAGGSGNGPRWAFVTHVRNRAGFDATNTLDAIAMDTWPSSGLLIHGFEIKCSRADWRRELARPEKAAAFTTLVDLFWVVAPPNVVRIDELPEKWGLLEVRKHGLSLVARVQPQRLSAAPRLPRLPDPVDRSFVACLLRAACHRGAASSGSGE